MDRQDTGARELGGVVGGFGLVFGCLLGGLAGCEAATYGHGAMDELAHLDDDSSEADGAGFDTEDDSGAGVGDQGGGEDAGETGDDAFLPECVEPNFEPAVTIELDSEHPLADPCADLIFSAEVAVSLVGIYGLRACDCDAPGPCNGEKFELHLGMPHPGWMPALEVGSCQRFRIFAEEVSPGVCRHNRVDIAHSPADPPWYSIGSAREDLAHGGLAVVPHATPLETCRGECGAWEVREAQFTAPDAEPLILGWDESGFVGPYEVIHWRSFVGPEGCGEDMTSNIREITAWTAR
jgi:hypothetical protein